jgi:hypothetical protein
MYIIHLLRLREGAPGFRVSRSAFVLKAIANFMSGCERAPSVSVVLRTSHLKRVAFAVPERIPSRPGMVRRTARSP